MILLIDNYDSFSYNLYQLIGGIDPEITVVRNDKVTVEDIRAMKPKAIVLSPGPGRPEDAGICQEVITAFGETIPILGVCLGHQAICQVYGATISYAAKRMHGKQSLITINNQDSLFAGLPKQIKVARYHSLAAAPKTMPDQLLVTAVTDDGEIMAVKHKTYPVFGVQFHPESILTNEGEQMISNFLKSADKA